MSLHFSDILDSAFFTVYGIWSLTGYLRETCLWMSTNLPLYKKGCLSAPQTKLNYGQSVQETTNARIFVQGPNPVYQDLSTYHDWPLVDLPISLRRNSNSHFWQLIPWVPWGPETIILVLLQRSYSPRLKLSLSEGSCFIKKSIFIWALSPYITCVENLAFRKPTRQSTTCSCGGSSGKAVDGKVGTSFVPGAQCAHTQDDNPSWWWVDLGSDNVPIAEVLLVNRFSPLEVIRQRNKDFVLTLGQ